MKVFPNLEVALSEIQRDLKKSPVMSVSRVQQRVEQDLKAREALVYTFSILPGGIPDNIRSFISLMQRLKFRYYPKDNSNEEMHPAVMEMWDWLYNEINLRLGNTSGIVCNEQLHPALKSTIEGAWPGYTYQDRLYGALDIMARAIDVDLDTRRAYWSLWRIEDSLRAHAPTRVPCSLSYQAFLRTINDTTQLEFLYTMRSSDYENFLPTDIFLANQFQLALSAELGYPAGNFMMSIASLHSFEVDGQEIY